MTPITSQMRRILKSLGDKAETRADKLFEWSESVGPIRRLTLPDLRAGLWLVAARGLHRISRS